MTPAEIEAMLEHLHARTVRIEQVLPTLATKQDLADGLSAVEARLGARIEALSRQMLVLHEDLKSDVRLLAEHLARVLDRLDGRR